jgi:hypothetical protein
MEVFFTVMAKQSCELVILSGKPNSQRGDPSYICRGLHGLFTSRGARNIWFEVA